MSNYKNKTHQKDFFFSCVLLENKDQRQQVDVSVSHLFLFLTKY